MPTQTWPRRAPLNLLREWPQRGEEDVHNGDAIERVGAGIWQRRSAGGRSCFAIYNTCLRFGSRENSFTDQHRRRSVAMMKRCQLFFQINHSIANYLMCFWQLSLPQCKLGILSAYNVDADVATTGAS